MIQSVESVRKCRKVTRFVPNEMKMFRPSELAWFYTDIRYRLKKQNNLFQKYKYKGYLPADRAVLDEYRSSTATYWILQRK